MAALWSHAWSTNYQVLELMQKAGLPRFSPAKPQRWVIASIEHHTSPHGLPQPHVQEEGAGQAEDTGHADDTSQAESADEFGYAGKQCPVL